MPTLSLAMIVKNEVDTLGHCLSSVKDLVDEMVVVDTGSTDATPAIARQFGARVLSHPWANDFSEARNASLEACHGDWVLVMDADEAIDSLDHHAIRNALMREGAVAYRLKVRNYLRSGDQVTGGAAATLNCSYYSEGKNFRYYTEFQALRLCRKLPKLAFQGRIHELLDPFFEEQSLSIENIQAVIHHYGKLFENREILKRSYYLDLAQRDARLHPNNLQILFNLFQQTLAAQAWEEALACGHRCLALHGKVPPFILLGMGVALQELNHPEEALAFLNRLLEAEPQNPAALVRKGVSLAFTQRSEEARVYFKKAIDSEPGFVLSYLNLAELESAQGRAAEAEEALEAGLRIAPDDPCLLEARVKLAAVSNNLEDAARQALFALSHHPSGGQGLWHHLVALQLWKEGRNEEAINLLREGVRLFPEHAELSRLERLFAD